MTTAALLAHQGGWDEIAFVAGPVAMFGALLLLAAAGVGPGRGGGISSR
ncbi:MAG: hypothetical protein R2695_02025 [Acidimicrobiales bacterium]